MEKISLGYSPCPNDTYIFYALVHGLIADAPSFGEVLEDIETLNSMAFKGQLDATKISFHALAHLRERYCLLHSGGALGRGCGPLVVARETVDPGALRGKRVAIPGKMTTAALLLQLFDAEIVDLVVMPFNEIMRAAETGVVDAGLIIHESRFTYPERGLKKVIDLGEWWEESTGHAIPLGGILMRRDLGAELIGRVDAALKQSVEYAHAHPGKVRDYIRTYAQEMDEEVIQAHIELYVNQYTLDYGEDGEAAIFDLMQRAEKAGLVEASTLPLFVS
jgi:1,4-dihydroxy-6-naphthoate synthase